MVNYRFQGIVMKEEYPEADDVEIKILKGSLRSRPLLTDRGAVALLNNSRNLADKYSKILSELSDYDAQGIMSLVNLPGFFASHYALEETGQLSYASESFRYDRSIRDIVDTVYDRLGSSIDRNEITLTIPKAKNTGHPYFISGSDRILNDLAVYLTSLMVEKAQKAGLNARQLVEVLVRSTGIPFFYAYGERGQSTTKDLPTFIMGSYRGHTSGIESRVRMINMVSKFLIIMGRLNSKKILKFLQTVPMHETDEDIRTKNIVSYLNNKDYFVFAKDHSKFDHHVAGLKTEAIRGSMMKILISKFGMNSTDAQTWYDDSVFELEAPKIFPFMRSVLKYEGGGYLPSGETNTTNHGLVGGDYAIFHSFRHVMRVTKGVEITKDNIFNYFGPNKDFFYYSWGDDMLLFYKKSILEDREDLSKIIDDGFSTCDHETTDEGTTRYLGKIYDIYRGSAAFRFVQSALNPERIKDPILYKLGMAVRFELLDPTIRDFMIRRVVPDLLKDVASGFPIINKNNLVIERRRYTDPISPTDLASAGWRDTVKKEALIRAEELAGGMQEIDKILYLLHHGSDDLTRVSEMLGVDFDMEYTPEALEKQIYEHSSEGKLERRLSLIPGNRGSLLSIRTKDALRRGFNNLSFEELIGYSNLLARTYNNLL
jgi:hypothetical protein